MPLVVFLRGVNVGGHRSFRPSLLAKELRDYDVVNIGAAGTFVVRNPGSKIKFAAALSAKLPFVSEIFLCSAREVLALYDADPFRVIASDKTVPGDTVRFVTVLPRARTAAEIPFSLPPKGKWYVRAIAQHGRFLIGIYRREMKTIGYLGEFDRLFRGKATTRGWKTIEAAVRLLNS